MKSRVDGASEDFGFRLDALRVKKHPGRGIGVDDYL